MKTDFQAFMLECQQRTEKALDQWLPSKGQEPVLLHEAMRYSVLNGGKRVRPMLVHAAGMVFDVSRTALDGPACAVEMIHVYSLIHDDLPAMDDDDLRRGQPTCHKAFDDATAILAGDALQALAFQVLAQDRNIAVDDAARLKMIETLTTASGSIGMAGGQAIDLAAEGKSQSLSELENMHAMKTGALIRASIRLGALSHPDISDDDLDALDNFGRCIGLAFQIQDDILDETGNTEKLGKPQGSDREKNKSTFPALYGLDESRRRAQALFEEAITSLDKYGQNASNLRQLAGYIVQRDY